MSDLMLDVGLADEIKMAGRRADATSADLKALASGDMFAKILPVLRGTADVTKISSLTALKQGVVLPARTKRFVPKTAFKIRKGRWLSPNMNTMVLPLTKPLPATPEMATHCRDLTVKMNEWDIMEEYPESVCRDVTMLLAQLDGLADLQPYGEAGGGLLVENYTANLFFFVPDATKPREGFVVLASWDSRIGRWGFGAGPLVGRVWGAGARVFSNCDT